MMYNYVMYILGEPHMQPLPSSGIRIKQKDLGLYIPILA